MIATAIILATTGGLSAGAFSLPRAAPAGIKLAEVVIRRETIIRLPVHRNAEADKLLTPERWIEKDKVKCLAIDNVGGAVRSGEESIDLVVRGGDRWRVRFADKCPALDFYQGFYFKPDAERKLCAKRDAVYARSGGECRIWSIRKLEIKAKK